MQATFSSSNASVTVNGVSYDSKAANSNITITEDGVYINGEIQTGSKEVMKSKKITIQVNGNVEEMVTHQGDVNVSQDVGRLEIHQGDGTIEGDVLGDAKCNQGDFKIGRDVGGNVNANMGDVKITGSVGGNAKTNMGDLIIKQKKAQKALAPVESKPKKPDSLFDLD